MTVILSSTKPDRRFIDFVHRLQGSMEYQMILMLRSSMLAGMDSMDELMMSGCSFIIQSDTEDTISALHRAFTRILRSGEEQTGVIVANADEVYSTAEIARVADVLREQNAGVVLSRPVHAGRTLAGDRLFTLLFRSLRYRIAAAFLQNGKLGICGISINLLPDMAACRAEQFENDFETRLKARKDACPIQLLPSAARLTSLPKLSFQHQMQQSVFLFLLLRFCLSGILSAAIDFGLLFIVQIWSKNLLVAVLTARAISSIFNFILNRTLVFHSKAKRRKGMKELIRYYMLVAVMLTFNYSLLSFFANNFHFSLLASKIVTEISLLSFSFIVQRLFVFRK